MLVSGSIILGIYCLLGIISYSGSVVWPTGDAGTLFDIVNMYVAGTDLIGVETGRKSRASHD